MADVKTSAFMLSSATLMLGRAFVDDVFALTPDKHSVGMVSEVSISIDSSLNSLLNGVAQAEVDAKRTGVATSITANVFEMTAANLLRSQALAASGATPVKRGVLTATAAGGATTLQIVSDPIPGEATSAITAIGDIPAGSSILIQRVNGETDFVFPTISSGAATVANGIYTIPIAGNYAVPADMNFTVGARVWVVSPVAVGALDADELFCAKIVGTLSNFDRPVVYIAPKVRMVKGFQLSFNETQYTSMPWEMRPQMLARGEVTSGVRLSEIGTRRSGRLYVGAGSSVGDVTPITPTPTPAPSFTTNPSISPTSGTAGTTTFTANDGVVTNGAITGRRWLLGSTAIGTGTTIAPTSGQSGQLTLEVTASGTGGTTTRTSVAVTVAAPATATVQTPPTTAQGFTYDFVSNPVTITKQTSGKYTTDLDPKSRVNQSIFTGATYWVSPTGSNTADGLSEATAVRSISVALKKLNDNTTVSGGQIRVKAGDYGIADNFNDSGGFNSLAGIRPNKHTGVIGYGGTPVNHNHRPNVAFTTDSGAYITTAARPNVSRVLDLTSVDAYGDYKEIPYLVDDASVNSSGSAGGWFLNSSNILRIKRPDGAAPTDANTRIFYYADCLAVGSASVDIYVENMELQGGDTSFNGRGGGNRNMILNGVTAKYSGTARAATIGTPRPSLGGNAFSFAGMPSTSFVGLFNCVGARAAQDGISFTGDFSWLTVDCVGRDNGMDGQVSCNGLTMHTNNKGIDLNGNYPRNAGGNVRMINQTQFWGLGTKASDDRGDVIYGGSLPPCDFNYGNTAIAFLQDPVAAGSQISLSVDSGAAVYLRNATLPNTQIKNGTVGPF